MPKFVSNFFNSQQEEWTIRRRIVLFLIVFCCSIIIWALGFISSDDRSTNAVNQAFNILVLVVTVYIGGKITDDYLKVKSGARTPRDSNPRRRASDRTERQNKEECPKEDSPIQRGE